MLWGGWGDGLWGLSEEGFGKEFLEGWFSVVREVGCGRSFGEMVRKKVEK